MLNTIYLGEHEKILTINYPTLSVIDEYCSWQ